MSPLDPQEVRLYRWADQLPGELWDDLARRDPAQAAQAAGAGWDGRVFTLDLLHRPHELDPGARTVRRLDQSQVPVGFQAGMVLVCYLAQTTGAAPAGRMALPTELPGGSLFFTGPHQVAHQPVAQAFGHDPESFRRRALELGGREMEGADAAYVLPGLPLLPVYALLWSGDDEFPARAALGVDARAHFHLQLDGVWGLTNLLSARLLGGEE